MKQTSYLIIDRSHVRCQGDIRDCLHEAPGHGHLHHSEEEANDYLAFRRKMFPEGQWVKVAVTVEFTVLED